mgnify:FL=1
MKNIALGKYTNSNTIIHKLDYRIKFMYLVIFMVISFLSYGSSYMTLTVDGIIFLIIIILNFIAKLNFLELFKSLKALWFMIVFLCVLNIFIPGQTTGDIAFTIGNLNVYYATILNLSIVFSRIILILAMTTLYSQTSKPMEMTKALEWFFSPLKLIKVPVSKLAMAISLALRFIPTLFEDTSRIMKAQASRGVDYKNGKFKDKIKSISSLLIPLFISSFQASDTLADALISRGYNPDDKRTKYKERKINISDIIFILLLILILSLCITQAVLKFDIYNFYNISLPN